MSKSLSIQENLLSPLLSFNPKFENESIVFESEGSSIVLEAEGVSSQFLMKILKEFNGRQEIDDILKKHKELAREDLIEIVTELRRNGLLDEREVEDTTPGMKVVLELEDILNKLVHEKIYKNIFWKTCLEKPLSTPKNVLYGLAIEHYHFLFRQSYFDAPVLAFQSNQKIHEILCAFFHDEYRHDKIVLKALKSIGLQKKDLEDSMPLPATMAMCNALAYWSRNDPLFFFFTFGILEGKDIGSDTYIEICKEAKLDEKFIAPIEAHANINLTHGHGNLTRLIFNNIPHIDLYTQRRLKAQIYLFVKMYNKFYEEVWNYYSVNSILLRRVSQI